MRSLLRHSQHFPKISLLLAALLLWLLSIATTIFFASRLSVGYQQKKLQAYVSAQQQDASNVLKDTALLRQLVLRTQSKEQSASLTARPYGLFLFIETLSGLDELSFWNSQKIIAPKPDFDGCDTVFFQQYLNGYYVVQKTTLTLSGMTNHVTAYVLIPVVHQYFLETENSQTRFAHDDDAIKKIKLAERITDFPVLNINRQPLFYLDQATVGFESNVDHLTIVLRLTALLFLLVAIHLFAETIYRKKGGISGIIFLGICLLTVRAILFFLPELFSLRKIGIFDPTIYASTLLNRSLGDLLINAILLCWFILYTWSHLGPIKKLPRFLKGKGVVVGGVAGVFVLIFVTFQLADVVHNMVVNSKISFEVTNYSNLTRYTSFSFLILALLSLCYYYFSRLLFRAIIMAFPNLVFLYFVVALVGLMFLTLLSNYRDVLFYLPVLLWLVIYTLVLTQEQSIINRFRITIAGILFWIFIFSVTLAALVMQGNRLREQQDRRVIARNLEEQTEPSREKSLSVSLRNLDNRFLLTNFNRFYKEPGNKFVRDSIANAGMTASFVTYNTSVYVFDAEDNPVNNPDGKSFFELDNIYTKQSKPTTGNSDLYFYELSFFEFMYIIKRPVYDSSQLKGTVFILAAPKLFENKALYPNLLTSPNKEDATQSYIFAVYKDQKLARYTGIYSFPTILRDTEIPEGEFENRQRNDYDELWHKSTNQKVIVVARKKESLIESITLFSYLFCSFLLLVGLIRFFELGAQLAREWPKVEIFSSLNIRSQIHITIIFISILSFLIIGAATISYFQKRSQRENIEKLSRTASSTLGEIRKQLKENSFIQTGRNFSEAAANASLREFVKEISIIHNVIVNVYDLSGNLQITSDDQIYKNGVLSKKMDPDAFFGLSLSKEIQRVQDESIGNYDYVSIYMAMQNSSHDTYAYVNIPSFSSQAVLKQEISNFLVTIINLNAFIILIAGVIALFITNRITRSFSVIGNKMKEIRLGKTNEEINWNKSDEIGELVIQYNKMVEQLEQSATALAKSEREGAWREMARQVAHEIKNPLTPMKLSIQYLQKAIQHNQPNVKELTSSVANTLIEQIDHLSKIAADFSQFANISYKRLEMIDLHNVIGSLLDLYAANPKVSVTWDPVLTEATMHADKTHMNRLFTNLLTNAVDACSEREHCMVSIAEKIVGNDILISITDNGDGIPQEMQSKIFTPNFTTKTSGTGLGLAMCKGIVEQAGGNIWFQTQVGEGTTFYVQLPLISQ